MRLSQALSNCLAPSERVSKLNPSSSLLCSPVTFAPSLIRNTGHTQAAGERREAREAGGGTGIARCRSAHREAQSWGRADEYGRDGGGGARL